MVEAWVGCFPVAFQSYANFAKIPPMRYYTAQLLRIDRQFLKGQQDSYLNISGKTVDNWNQ